MSGERSGRPPGSSGAPPASGAPTRLNAAVSGPYDSSGNDNATLANIDAGDIPVPRGTLPGGAPDMNAALSRGPGFEEPTMQGASFLVERITPVPPGRDTLIHAAPRVEPAPGYGARPAPHAAPGAIAAQAARMVDSRGAAPALDEPTAAVPNPGSRPPPREPAREASVQALPLKPAPTPASMQMALPRGPQDAPPEVDTAFVPVVGPGAQLPPQAQPQAQYPAPQGGPQVAPLQAPPGFAAPQAATVTLGQNPPNLAALAPARPPGPVTVFLKKNFPNILVLAERIQGNKNARLALIAVCGMLGVGLTLMLFPVRQPSAPLPPLNDGAGPAAVVQNQRQLPSRSPENLDPVQQEERDRLLEKAVLAVEAGRSEEALAIFRRYAEEDDSAAAAFMIQLLQVQLSQSGREQ